VAVMLAVAALVAPGLATGQVPPNQCTTSASGTVSCEYFSNDAFVVPPGVTEIFVSAGGSSGEPGTRGQHEFVCAIGQGPAPGSAGAGSAVEARIPVSPGKGFHIEIGNVLRGGSGGIGHSFNSFFCAQDADPFGGDGGAGGDGAGLSDSSGWVLVAAGGGGGGGSSSTALIDNPGVGGDGGAGGQNGFAGGGVGVPGAGGACCQEVSGSGQAGGNGGGQVGAGGGGGGGGVLGGAGAAGTTGQDAGGGGGGGGSSLVPSGGTVGTWSGRPRVLISYNVAPTTAIDIVPAAPTGDNGWYRFGAVGGDPLVRVLGVDTDIVETRCALDPVGVSAFADLPASCPFLGGLFTVGSDGEHSLVAASKDATGNVEALKTLAFKVDNTLPTITAAATTEPNLSGWYTAPVTVHYTCDDATSGVWIEQHPCPADHVFSDEGEQLASPSRTTVDRAGNVSAPSNVVSVKIDLTPPTITGGPTTQPNDFGWYNHDVDVNFSCHDDLSGIPVAAQLFPCKVSSVTTEGINTVTARRVFDRAGNESAPAGPFTIRIDKTPPVVSVPAPITVSATSPAGAAVNYQSGATDNLDQSPAVACTPASGGIFPIGTTTVTCTATDVAGNTATKQFTVKVLGAAEQLDLLRIAATGVGSGTSLADKVKQIQKAVAEGKSNTCSLLNDFLGMVATQLNQKKLTSAQAASLTRQANNLKGTLSC
jgi:HYR domain